MLNKLKKSVNDGRNGICWSIGLCTVIISIIPFTVRSQVSATTLFSKNALYTERVKIDANIKRHIKNLGSGLPVNDDTEYQYEAACNVVSQYLLEGAEVDAGFARLFDAYPLLSYDTKRAFLEAVFAVGKSGYTKQLQQILLKENQDKLFAMAAVYLLRSDSTGTNAQQIKELIITKFEGLPKPSLILKELLNNIAAQSESISSRTPDMADLFAFQQIHKQKVVYSFQRRNRDYTGLAMLQLENGQFARHADGRLMVFEQLARSASSLPYFITNGNTPQGCYRITGTAQSKIGVIGPTPNLQLLMPFEQSWKDYLGDSAVLIADTTELFWEEAYWNNFPISWQSYQPMKEVLTAGKIGRTEIIAHGTTIDPEYYAGKPFYPLTPTMGCLCAREQWNVTTGRIAFSEQYNLANAWHLSPSQKGLLYVINIDDQQNKVSRAEVEAMINTIKAGDVRQKKSVHQ